MTFATTHLKVTFAIPMKKVSSYFQNKLLLHLSYLLLWITIGIILFGGINLFIFESLGIDQELITEMGADFIANIYIFKWLQILATILLMVLPALALSHYITGNLLKYSISFPVNTRRTLLSVLGLVALFPIVAISMQLNLKMELPSFLSELESWMRSEETEKEKLTMLFLNMDSLLGLLFNLLMIAVMPALGEELLFRGSIQNSIAKAGHNPHIAIIISAFLFSAIHLQFYGFLPRFLIGVYFGYLFYYGGNIFYPISCHLLHNGIQVVMVYMGYQDLSATTGSELPALDIQMCVLGGLSFVAIVGILYLYRGDYPSQSLANGMDKSI